MDRSFVPRLTPHAARPQAGGADSGASALQLALAGALSLAIAMGIGRFGFTPLVPLMAGEGRLTLDAAGWIAAANYVGYLAGAMSADRVPLRPKPLALVALSLTIVLTAAMALPLGTAGWLVLRFFAGAASAWAFVATSVWSLGALVALRKSHWASAVYTGVGGGIALVGAYCLVGAARGASAASLWLQLGGLALALTVPVALVLRHAGVGAERARRAAAARAPMPAGTPGLLFAYAAFGYGYILPATFLPVLARSVLADAHLFGLAWPVFGITAAASTLAAGWLLRRGSRLHVWAAAQFLMGVGVVLPSLWLSAVTVTLSALLVGGTFMVCTMVGIQEIRARAAGDATHLVAWMTTAFALGQIAGPVTSSLLLAVPALAPHALDLALQVAAAVLALSAGWLWRELRAPQA